MNGTLILRNPVMINGKSVGEMSYDTEEITGELFTAIESRHRKAAGFGNMAMCEVDAGLHLYMGYAAIIALNPEYDVSDLARMKGVDVSAVMRIGRNFINPSGDSRDGSTEKPAGTTPGSTTPAPLTLQENG